MESTVSGRFGRAHEGGKREREKVMRWERETKIGRGDDHDKPLLDL